MQADINSRKEEAATIIHGFAVAHAAVAFILANTAIGDTIVLTFLTYTMIGLLAKIYGANKVSPFKLIARIGGLIAGTYIAGKLLFWLPGIGNAANAATTIFITEVIGWTCVALFESGRSIQDVKKSELKRIVDESKVKAEQAKKETEEVYNKMTLKEKETYTSLAQRLKKEKDTLDETERKKIINEIKELYNRVKNR